MDTGKVNENRICHFRSFAPKTQLMNYAYLLWGLVILLMVVLIYRRVKQFKELMKGSDQVDDSKVIHLDDKNFSNTVKSGLILVDFWAPWCGPCKVVGPIVADLANKYEGKAKVGKLNVDENQATASKYGIRSIPTLILFKDGKPVEQLVGVRPKQALEKLIDKHLA